MTKQPHLLNLGNARKVKENLSGILSPSALDRIETEIAANTVSLIGLARKHYKFAAKQSPANWRQKVSRVYYAAYNAVRAVRFYVAGEYSTEVKDHYKFDKLPDDFPHRARYVNQLAVLRTDRNTSDYDHLSSADDLILGSTRSAVLVKELLDDAVLYLRKKGLDL